MSQDTESTANNLPKYTRYKSVRHTMQPDSGAAPERIPEQDVHRTKSMSRYRRSRGPISKPEHPPLPEVPVPVIPSVTRANTTAVRSQHSTPVMNPGVARNASSRRVAEPIPAGGLRSNPPEEYQRAQTLTRPPQETENERLRRKIKEFQEREALKTLLSQQAVEQTHSQQLRKIPAGQAQLEAEPKRRPTQRQPAHVVDGKNNEAVQSKEIAARILAEEKARATQLNRQAVETEADRARKLEEENARALEEQKKKDLERLQKELDAAVPVASEPKLHSLTSPLREKFSFFSRKRDSARNTPPPTPKSAGSKTAPAPIGATAPRLPGFVDAPKKAEKPKEVDQSLQIGQGGGGIVPQTDAPISASNAGERRVLIRCKQSSINLPITPETTPSELIYSAANIMSQDITPASSILIESYTQLGLERRVRRYEHVRDVMNSWDRDTQNAFILQNSESSTSGADLEVSSVPREPPADVSVYMYHSQKPGKWNKRYITLLSSGQIYMSKKAGVKPSEKDALNLCHLSDFDIYTPTPQQIRKTLKPPKKHCYAVKSQQKTAMFLSTENFVHFFSTDDELLAQKWYAAVQGWRSWYLVNRMGEGKKKASKKDEQRPGGARGQGHLALPSVDDNPYTIGSFTPLFELTNFVSSGTSEDDNSSQERGQRQNSLSLTSERAKRESKRHPPPVSYRVPSDQEEEFAAAGLLGRTYSQRQRDQTNNRDERDRTFSMASSKSRRPGTAGDGLKRSSSQRKPKPLLDFTPQFKEAPQWDKTGKGRGVAPTMGGLLVETATTPATGLDDIPKATVFRRETTAGRQWSGANGGGGASSGGNGFIAGGLLSGLNNPKGGGSIMNRGRVVYD